MVTFNFREVRELVHSIAPGPERADLIDELLDVIATDIREWYPSAPDDVPWAAASAQVRMALQLPPPPPVNDPQVDEAAVERASRIDRGWFRSHPERAYRLRFPVAGEFPDERPPEAGDQRMVLVKQVLPGARLRCPVWVFQRPRDCDASLGEAWDVGAPESFKRIALGMATTLLREA